MHHALGAASQLLIFSVPSPAVHLGSTLLLQSPQQEGMLFGQTVK